MDRGPDTIAIYNLFDKLRKQAKAAGGQVKENGHKRQFAMQAITIWAIELNTFISRLYP